MGHLVGGDRGGEKPEQHIFMKGAKEIFCDQKSFLRFYNKKYDV